MSTTDDRVSGADGLTGKVFVFTGGRAWAPSTAEGLTGAGRGATEGWARVLSASGARASAAGGVRALSGGRNGAPSAFVVDEGLGGGDE